MKLPKVIRFVSTYRLKSFFEFKLFMRGITLDEYIKTWDPIFPDYINLELLKYLLSIGSCIACRIYYHNGFKDCILIADDFGIPIGHVTKVERSSKFKIYHKFRKTGQDILIKVNLNV